MKQQKGRDYSSDIIWAAAIVGMIRYAAAFAASDLGQITGTFSEVISILLAVSGFAMGLLGTFATAYVFDGWRRKMPASGQAWPFKFQVLTLFVFAAFTCELVILVPFTVSRMDHVSMTETLGMGVWWWSAAVNVMPMLLIGGVSVGNQIVTVASESSGKFRESSGDMTESSGKVPESSGKVRYDWRKYAGTFSDDQLVEIAVSDTGNLRRNYPGMSDKTGRNWRRRAVGELSNRHWSIPAMEARGIRVREITRQEEVRP